jgi:hypothetical protein
MKKTFLILAAGLLTLSSCKELLCEKGIYPFCEDGTPSVPMTGSFTEKALGNGGEEQSAFSANGIGYVGLGGGDTPQFGSSDFYSYDPTTDAWTKIADLPAQGRVEAVAFAIDGKGYVGGGNDGDPADFGNSRIPLSDFWQYDPVTNSWVKKADLPVADANIGFAVGLKGYVLKDKKFWEYNSKKDQWKALPDAPVSSGLTFTIGPNGYVLQGLELWEYNAIMGKWSKKMNAPGGAKVAFSTSTKGYIQSGYYIYEYNPLTDKWIQKSKFPKVEELVNDGVGLKFTYAFGLKEKGYISVEYRGDQKFFFEFDPQGGEPL